MKIWILSSYDMVELVTSYHTNDKNGMTEIITELENLKTFESFQEMELDKMIENCQNDEPDGYWLQMEGKFINLEFVDLFEAI